MSFSFEATNDNKRL